MITTQVKSNWCDFISGAEQIADLTRKYPWLSASEIGDMLMEAADDDGTGESPLAATPRRIPPHFT